MILLAEVKETVTKPGLRFFKNPNSVCAEIKDDGFTRMVWDYSMTGLLNSLDEEALGVLIS